MNGLSACRLRHGNQCIALQIAFCWGGPADQHGLIGHRHMFGCRIGIGINRNRPHPHITGCFHHATGNFTTVGDQYLVKHCLVLSVTRTATSRRLGGHCHRARARLIHHLLHHQITVRCGPERGQILLPMRPRTGHFGRSYAIGFTKPPKTLAPFAHGVGGWAWAKGAGILMLPPISGTNRAARRRDTPRPAPRTPASAQHRPHPPATRSAGAGICPFRHVRN